MIIQLAKNRLIGEVREEFANGYPFLRLDFYKNAHGRPGASVKQKLNKLATLANAGLRHEGEIEIRDSMTVRELEGKLRKQFGLLVQVARKSGKVWLQTTKSDDWTLQQQNERGRELCAPIEKDLMPGPIDPD
jgi:hypothetical protein